MNAVPLPGLSGIARRLVNDGLLAEHDARKAADEAARQKMPIGAWLIENALVSSTHVMVASSAEFGIPLIDAEALDLAQLPMKLVREDLINKHKVLPLFKRGNRLFVGISDPTNLRALDEIKFQANHIVEPILIDEEPARARDRAGDECQQHEHRRPGRYRRTGEPRVCDAVGDDGDSTGVDANAAMTHRSSSSSTRCWSTRSSAARRISTSNPTKPTYRVRFRMDGMLRAVASPPIKLSPRISSRLKVMSGLDIAEKRVPQDGRIKLNLSKTKAIDFRVSTCPTLFGEKIVLRILDASAAKLGIEKLGYEDDQRKLFTDAIAKPYGMVLVTGPTGSGKTVSLYTGAEYSQHRRSQYLDGRGSG